MTKSPSIALAQLQQASVAVLYGGVSDERAASEASATWLGTILQELKIPFQAVDVAEPDFLELIARSSMYAINVAHGHAGEDGSLSALLTARQVPFAGSSAAASALTFNKLATNTALRSHGIPVPHCVRVSENASGQLQLPIGVHPPVVIKPITGGSGRAVVLADSDESLSLQRGQRGTPLIAETYIDGLEVCVVVIRWEQRFHALPPVALKYPGPILDSAAREGLALQSATLDNSVSEALTTVALNTHILLGLGTWSKIDFRFDQSGVARVIEVDAIPGMSQTSVLPYALACAGISPTMWLRETLVGVRS